VVIQPAVAPPPKDAQRAFSPLIQGVKDKPGFNAFRINSVSTNYKRQSYPIQDEPEGEVGFQYKMSLKGVASCVCAETRRPSVQKCHLIRSFATKYIAMAAGRCCRIVSQELRARDYSLCFIGIRALHSAPIDCRGHVIVGLPG